MERYRRQQSELYFTDAGKRRLVEAITAPARTRAPRPRRRLRIAAAIAAALALTVSAGALSPGIRGLLSDALGGFGDYVQEVQTDAVVDQDIEITVISAMADSNATVVYAQARDLTGNRLQGEMRISGFIQSQNPEPGTGSVSGAECVGYDEETGAALLKFTSINTPPVTDAGAVECQLIVVGFEPQEHSIKDLALPNELLTGETLNSFRLAEDEIIPDGTTTENPTDMVLEPGQTPVDIGSELVSLSSMGFAADGRLHIQLEVPADASPLATRLLTTIYSRSAEELDMSNDEAVQQYNELISRYNGDVLSGIWFTHSGRLYYDMSFPAGPEALDDILLDTVYGMVSFDNPIDGLWIVPLTVEAISETRIPFEGPRASQMELILSPLSLHVYAEGTNFTYMNISGKPAAACLRDGSRIEGKSWGSAGLADEYISCQWLFDQPVDLDQLTGIIVGDWMIPIADGAAGEPYLIG